MRPYPPVGHLAAGGMVTGNKHALDELPTVCGESPVGQSGSMQLELRHGLRDQMV